ncbi:MAG: Na+/H+ antiporter [Chloroflexota bacterium]
MSIGPIQLFFLLLVAATGLAYLARRFGVAYPIMLVLGGLVLGFVPNLPRVEIDPDLVFLLLLPPVLFGAGFSTPIRELKANRRPIALLAIGLVLFTTVVVAVVAHALVPNLDWGPAFALGAIVAPPDAAAATAIFRRLGVPRRVVAILEGESLLNDAAALVVYRFAIAATLTGSFSLVAAPVQFLAVAAGGIVVGGVVGLVVTEAWRRTTVSNLEIAVSLIAPFAAYLPAELLGVSGVLSAVVAGVIAGRRSPRVLSAEARLLGQGVWDIVIFLINGAVFILIGLSLPVIIDALGSDRLPGALALGLVMSLTVILARFAWVFPATYIPRWVSSKIRQADPAPPPNAVFVIAWAGMRGAVSLAAALALPIEPEPFPERDLIIFLVFCVILATLVGQGLTLAPLVRRLGVTGPGAGRSDEEVEARAAATSAAVEELDRLELRFPTHMPLIEQLRDRFDHEASHATTDGERPPDESEQELIEHRQIRRGVIDAEREAVIRLRDEGTINDDTLRRIERDLDLEELRMEA